MAGWLLLRAIGREVWTTDGGGPENEKKETKIDIVKKISGSKKNEDEKTNNGMYPQVEVGSFHRAGWLGSSLGGLAHSVVRRRK